MLITDEEVNEHIEAHFKREQELALKALRDKFAGQAMQSALIDWSTPTRDADFELVTSFAYKIADAMIKARGE